MSRRLPRAGRWGGTRRRLARAEKLVPPPWPWVRARPGETPFPLSCLPVHRAARSRLIHELQPLSFQPIGAQCHTTPLRLYKSTALRLGVHRPLLLGHFNQYLGLLHCLRSHTLPGDSWYLCSVLSHGFCQDQEVYLLKGRPTHGLKDIKLTPFLHLLPQSSRHQRREGHQCLLQGPFVSHCFWPCQLLI